MLEVMHPGKHNVLMIKYGEKPAEGRCEDCAFTKGTEANSTPWTRVTVELCLIANEPFCCHAKGKPQPLCAGFVEAMEKQPEHPEWRRVLAAKLLELQYIAE